jgi:hypothetical protein
MSFNLGIWDSDAPMSVEYGHPLPLRGRVGVGGNAAARVTSPLGDGSLMMAARCAHADSRLAVILSSASGTSTQECNA